MTNPHPTTNMATDERRVLAWVAALALLACLLMLAGNHLRQAPTPLVVTIDMATSTKGSGQVFFKTPNGYSETRAIALPLSNDGRRQRYQVQMPVGDASESIRIDPGTGAGDVSIYAVGFKSGMIERAVSGTELHSAIRPLKDLSTPRHLADGLQLRSTGGDPFLELSTPEDIRASWQHIRTLGYVLLLLGGGIGGFALVLSSHHRMARIIRHVTARGGVALFALTAVAAFALLAVLSVGCEPSSCSPRGVKYGSALLLAATCFAIIGAASLELIGLRSTRSGSPRIFLWMTVGQVVILLYVSARSAIHALVPQVPLTTAELFAVVAIAAIYLGRKTPWTEPAKIGQRARLWWVVELALLAVVCIVVADRELPRTLMLSSDPDTHAYLGRQVELLGAIPWLGESVFNYPAGSAALTWSWARFSFLDVRNALTALPLLQAFAAALMLGEAVAVRARALSSRLAIVLTALAITGAGFLVPLFVNYSHMEGAGRQIAIAFAAIIPSMIVAAPRHSRRDERRFAAVAAGGLFALAVLNPINIVVPCILLAAYACHVAIAQRRLSWLLVPLVTFPALLLLDPYYLALITSSEGSVAKISITSAFRTKDVGEVLAQWAAYHAENPTRFIREFWAMSTRHRLPLFAILLVVLVGLHAGITRRFRVGWQPVVAVIALLCALNAAEGLFHALRDDSRFYLLWPYFTLGILQHKILLVTAAAAIIVWLGWLRKLRPVTLVALATLPIVVAGVGMRRTQAFVFEPRAHYCGSLGCATGDDTEVLRRFAALTMDSARGDGLAAQPRVLVPNSVHETPNESWVFPVSGARALPFFDVFPVAFYYYQGDDDYTTDSYVSHVCERFDRAWLKSQHIEYIFLPSDRSAACVYSMETLPFSEEIVLHVGNSYLLRLK